MKKMVLTVMIGILLIAVNLFAAGDLIVDGKVGIGTATPSKLLDVQASEEQAVEIKSTVSGTGTVIGTIASVALTNSATRTGQTRGLNAVVSHTGTGNVTGKVYGGRYNIFPKPPSDVNPTFSNLMGITSIIENDTIYRITITRAVGFEWEGLVLPANSTVTNAYGMVINNSWYSGATSGTLTGLQINKQTVGATNYGLVLNGDGAGADVVFGPSKNVRIYSQSGELYAKDGADNVTLISPHNPQTGEWIFYSKNIKTGKVVRVDMERLVKAVEKLTGEKFMIETVEEIK